MPLRCLVIGRPDESLGVDASSLSAAGFSVSFIAPVYLDSEVARRLADPNAFKARHLRDPLTGDVGASIAHRNAYEEFLNSDEQWSLFAEEDAEIPDAQQLADRVRYLIAALDPNRPTVVSFYFGTFPVNRFWRSRQPPHLYRAPVPPPFAVTYLVNRPAAERLIAGQTPVASPPDWPVTARQVQFLLDGTGLAAHSRDGVSTIDPDGVRNRIPRNRRVLVWTGAWGLRNRRAFSSPLDYWDRTLKAEVVWRVGRVMQRVAG